MSDPVHYDVVIAGGGMVGATLACALGDSPLHVALVEESAVEQIHPAAEIDLRVSAITRASQRILEGVGVWESIAASRISPFRNMRVWDASGSGRIHFDSAAIGEPLLGWIIENRVIQYALLKRSQTFDNVDLFCPATLSQAPIGADEELRLQLNDRRQLRANLLVGADGASSRVRGWTGIAVGGWGYDQKAVVSTVGTEKFHEETAWQRFLSTGPVAFLPLHDGRCSIVWSTTLTQADHLLALDEADFALELAQAFEWSLGKITEVGPRGAFVLRLQHAYAYVKPRIALIGDAAHVVHPLAGQGVNLGLLDAATLAEVLLDAVAADKEIGSLRVLRRYERWRKGENLLMLGVLDGFKRLFGSRLPPVRMLRNLGLNLMDAATPLKNLIARQAMGLAGDLPRLARNPYGN